MSDESKSQANEDEQPTGQGGGEDEANAGPPEDIENDPAYDPDDPGLKGLKGG
jgi:hypothetical protein